MGGTDSVFAAGGNDTVNGAEGNDTELRGEGGDDNVYGNADNDIIDAATGDTPNSTDNTSGGGGNDTIYANDDNVDTIKCGRGNDFVTYDQASDTVKGCENKTAV
jgi:Ca2+-binding RTX toxin-like protein